MSLKWTGGQSESGILRKSEYKEKKEDLFVFGYSCKLFRDDDRALHIDQGKHLIPWMGDETLKIDRYDARGALHDLSRLEAPPGGYDWRVELSRDQQDVEQLCDEERYRALHTDEDEEEMYKEEELKRLHAAGYGQVGFNYDAPSEPAPALTPTEVDEPFIPTPAFKALLPVDIVFPESLKQNAIIEKTANFIATQGAQMEILIKAKQRDNPQFNFLARDSTLHNYYTSLIGLVKSGKWPEKKVEIVEEKPPENEEYLHPSLATSTVIESAPAIPSIHYKPSADCDYTMLISKMRGEGEGDGEETSHGDVPPPGTEPPRHTAQIYRPPVMYTRNADGNHVDPTVQQAPPQTSTQLSAHQRQYTVQEQQIQKKPSQAPLKSTGLSLMKNYNTDSDSDVSDFDDNSSTDSKEPAIATPPEDVQIVIDKMASYVARNGDEFADIVRAKNDPRFTFLEPDNIYHAFYKKLMQHKRGGDVNGKEKINSNVPVSFSIKKQKEPDPILPKPALPYESSSDEDSEKHADKQEEVKDAAKPIQPLPVNNIPPVVVYKIEGQMNNDLPIIKTIEPVKTITKPPLTIVADVKIDVPKAVVVEEKAPIVPEKPHVKEIAEVSEAPIEKIEPKIKDINIERERDRESPNKAEKKKYRDRKKEYRSRSESRESRRKDHRSVDRERKKEKDTERDHKKSKCNREELENEVISLEDNSDDLIDLTGEQSDSKVEETEVERAKQQERRRRAAEFLKKVGVDPSAAQLPTSSLASAMVDTLESLRKKKAEEEEKRRRRDKRRHRDRRDYDGDCDRSHRKSKRRKHKSSEDNDESDYDSSKKKRRKKDRKHSTKNKRKRRQEDEIEEEDAPLPINIDLTNTLRELRTSSPTKELGLHTIEDSSQSILRRDSSDEELVRVKRKTEREYSEGEWSSDSEGDSKSSRSRDDY